jgi:hypothetical protein
VSASGSVANRRARHQAALLCGNERLASGCDKAPRWHAYARGGRRVLDEHILESGRIPYPNQRLNTALK